MVRLQGLWILSRNTFDQSFMTKEVSAARKFHYQNRSFMLWDLEFLNGNGCKSVTAEKKGHFLFEVIFTHRVASSFWIFGWLAWDKVQCQFTRMGKRIWGNKNYCFSTNVFITSAIVS